MTPDQTIDLFRTASAQQWRYNLERIEATTLQAIQKTVDKTRRQIVGEMASTMKDVNLRAHSERVLKELDDLSLGLRKQLGQDLQSATSYVGSRALQEQYDMMSVNGLSPLINNVALSPAQFNAFLTTNPVKGLLIPQWIDKAYGASVKRGLQEGILEELQVGALRGESYARIVSRLESGFDQLTKRELTTLTRTFFQDANTRAYDAIHKANADVIEGRIWTVAADDRVCILCLPLSEELYRDGEPHPEMPRHPNCRCCWRAKTVSYRSLGIDIDELEPIEKAVVTRGYEKDGKWIIPPVGTGGARIRSISFHKGGIKEAFPGMPEAQQKAMIGARRLEMYKAGTLKLDDLVNPNTGRLMLLDELRPDLIAQRRAVFEKARSAFIPKPPVAESPASPAAPTAPLFSKASVWENSSDLKEVKRQFKEHFNITSITGATASDKSAINILNALGSSLAEEVFSRFPALAERLAAIPGKSKLRKLVYEKTAAPLKAKRPTVLANYWPVDKHIRMGQNSMARTTPELSLGAGRHNVGLDVQSVFRHEYGHHVGMTIFTPTQKKQWESFFSKSGRQDLFRNSVSRYAATDAAEAFAEAFAAITSKKYDWSGPHGTSRRLPRIIEEKIISLIGAPSL